MKKTPFVLLATISAASIGENFVEANVVIISDPQWNPGAELQAYKRVHRKKQLNEVFVYKLCALYSNNATSIDEVKDSSCNL